MAERRSAPGHRGPGAASGVIDLGTARRRAKRSIHPLRRPLPSARTRHPGPLTSRAEF